jgi:hypothetical protein
MLRAIGSLPVALSIAFPEVEWKLEQFWARDKKARQR